ncbi:MAG: hypothetical protein K8U57_34185 [Planctomycetes bacterium]|nr:hypothetical protein [Planctomycetota bacterium]
MIAFSRRLAPLGLVLLASLGCSENKPTEDGKVVVKGKLLDNGKPLVLTPSLASLPKGATGVPPGTGGGVTLTIVFVPVDSNEQTQAKPNLENMTFEANLKPGKYKVAVTAKFGIAPDAPEYFKGIFTLDRTQIVREVKAGEDIVIDVSKPQG